MFCVKCPEFYSAVLVFKVLHGNDIKLAVAPLYSCELVFLTGIQLLTLCTLCSKTNNAVAFKLRLKLRFKVAVCSFNFENCFFK